jgi:AcrR family transcriptional regulator
MTAPRRRGRHAEGARNDERVLAAAREVFSTQGVDAPVAAVAEQAGLGIASLYRRYGSKEELLQRLCVLAMNQTVEAAEEGLADPDPWRGLSGYVRRCAEHRAGALAPLAGRIPVTDEMLRTATRGTELADELVARAQTAGVLRTDVTALDLALLVELFSRRTPTAPPAEDRVIRQRLLAIALAGLRAPAAVRLPGEPPTRHTYTSRWTTD